MPGRERSKELLEGARKVRALLEYAASLGLTELPVVKAHARKGRSAALRPVIPRIAEGDRAGAMAALRAKIGECKMCKLHKGRTKVVFGAGNPGAELMFIGEGPGRDEDMQGEPFVGLAGQLLTKIIKAMGLCRDDVYIANIIKCRPPNNRNPEPDEVAACIGFLMSQVEIIRPRVIVCLGGVALQSLFSPDLKISRARGRFLEWQGIPVMPTYHPAFLLRNEAMKKPVWEDMQKVM
ncbi:MAG: uracil-DNA glycosylase, partial [Proteobacteria bacterium]|nr:uracil-DNA glycosylase [Pseudomonadota bacterium]